MTPSKPLRSHPFVQVAMTSRINVAISLDRKVLLGALVAVRSLIDNLSTPAELHVFVIHSGLRPRDKRTLSDSWHREGIRPDDVHGSG